MFESVAIPAVSRRRFGAPAAVSLALHLAAVASVPWLGSLRATLVPPAPEPVSVVLDPRRPSAAAADRSAVPPKPRPRPKRRVAHRPVPAAFVAPPAPVEPPPPAPAAAPEPEPVPEPARPDGTLGGTGTAPGTAAGLLHTNAEGNVEYDDAIMTPPERISGPDPEYTYLARAHDVQGLMVVKCIVTTAGTVRDCKIVQGLPYMEGAVVDALLHRRYTPARLRGGEPVEVEYTFRIRLQLVR
jgi:protein TonB